MSTQLYRLDPKLHPEPYVGDHSSHMGRCFLPVEPCSHGNVFPHHISYTQSEEGNQWWDGKTCNGARLGDTDG